jgi:ABC-type uncharacterized transport system involved in gliding motility auxiliary subunit
MSADNTKKKRVYASNAVLYAVFVIGAVVLVNLVSTRIFGRADLTENKVYTLSQSSKDLVKTLPDYMSVKAFISADLPPQIKLVSRYVRDLVDEYKTSSNGKFKWEVIDPGTDKKLEEEASRCKVQKLQIQTIQDQKFAIGAYYLGLCLEYGGQIESIPQVVQAEGLEYQMSSLIKKMTTKKKKIAFTTGHGELDTNQGFQALREDLSAEFEVTTVNPSQAEIGQDVDALVVGGPKQAFDEKGRREIDRFLMQGKGVVFLVDGMAMQSPGGMGGMPEMQQMKMGQNNDHGLGELLGAYGFKIGEDFVFDHQNVPGPIDVGGRRMLSNAPWFVGAEFEKDKDLSVLAGLQAGVFPFASSVELTGPLASGKADKGKLWKLASSSKKSWKHTGFLMITPGMKIEESKDKGPFALGYAYEGGLKSAYPPPEAPAVSSPDAKETPPSESKKPVRLVVVGDSDLASDEYVQLARFLPFYAAGPQLLYNAISWTVEDEALVPLRSKTMAARPIALESPTAALALQWGNVLGLPLAFCLFGVVRWRVRRATRLGQKL